ncbi:MAG TPA: carboxypeptidase regulatory-like domain-containing protein [Planctomycetaceae bacterium]|nr:carboxypeptidase regulatory-like domain-containing protein [Planctomycetaceae bacterium]
MTLVTAAVVSCLRADDSKTKNALTVTRAVTMFDLRIVGPDGKPIPDAKVELRRPPDFQAAQIRVGTFLNRSSFAVKVRSDASGRIVFERPDPLQRLDLYITMPGYAPYWAGWDLTTKPEPIPARLTAQLNTAWSIGGIIVDEDGKPVVGARISPLIEFKKRPGESRQLMTGDRFWTNGKGVWRFDSVPASMSEVSVEIYEPNFQGAQPMLSRGRFGIQPGHEPTAKIVLKKGLVVTGKVTDEAGKPIARAVVRTKFMNEVRSTATGADGVYTLESCTSGPARIVASALGHALELQQVQIGPKMQPVDFHMQRGKTIRVRVLDEQGYPIPKASIFFQAWRGHVQYFEFERVPQYANAQGLWEWNEAPADEICADIVRPDGMTLGNRLLMAGDQEIVFRVPLALVVSGKVIDAATKRPIEKFRVSKAIRLQRGDLLWNDTFAGTGGHYEIREKYEYPHFQVLIAADGYARTLSREIKSEEGNVSIDFELIKGPDVPLTVLMPDGSPAAGAKLAMGSVGSRIKFKNGNLDEAQTSCLKRQADSRGRLTFEMDKPDFWLVITHPSGYAQSNGVPNSPTLRLTPWARVEGTLRVARKLQANTMLQVECGQYLGQNGPRVFTEYRQATDSGGRFVFERVFPAEGRVGRFIPRPEMSTEMVSAALVPATFVSGKTTVVDLGTSGRPVIGQLRRAANSTVKVPWRHVIVDPPGTTFGGRSLQFVAVPDGDGNFCIDDVPPGNYVLHIFIPNGRAFEIEQHPFSVPTINQTLSQRPVDIGVITLRR